MKQAALNSLRPLAILGNALFILWVSFNAMDEGFKGTIVQKMSAIGLIALLLLNITLLSKVIDWK